MTTSTVLTAEDLYEYDDDRRKVELVRGRLVIRDSPGGRHGQIALRIGILLHAHLVRERDAQGWAETRGRLTLESGYILERAPDTVRGPDIAYTSRTRQPAPLPDTFLELAPDLAVEVRSPSNRRGDIESKLADYRRAGVQQVWVVSPRRETVVVHHLDGTDVLLTRTDTLTGGDVLPGFSVPVAELFVDE